jgi:hypothetical protein
MNLILDPEKRKEIGRRASTFVRERFPVKAIAKLTKEVYEEVS